MPEQHTPSWIAASWDARPEPLLQAARAAIQAAEFDPLVLSVSAEWEQREGQWDDLEEAEQRLAHTEAPRRMSIILTEGVLVGQPVCQASTHIFAMGDRLTVSGHGLDWPKTERGFQAARRVLHEVYGPPVVEEPLAPGEGVDAPEVSAAPSPGPSRLERGLTVGGVLLPWELVALITTVTLAVIGWAFFT